MTGNIFLLKNIEINQVEYGFLKDIVVNVLQNELRRTSFIPMAYIIKEVGKKGYTIYLKNIKRINYVMEIEHSVQEMNILTLGLSFPFTCSSREWGKFGLK